MHIIIVIIIVIIFCFVVESRQYSDDDRYALDSATWVHGVH